MNNRVKKQVQVEYANHNIKHFFNLLDSNFEPELNKKYIKEILRISSAFNIRLSREQKVKFCRKCSSYFNNDNKQIRFNSKLGCIEYICFNCNNVRRISYK